MAIHDDSNCATLAEVTRQRNLNRSIIAAARKAIADSGAGMDDLIEVRTILPILLVDDRSASEDDVQHAKRVWDELHPAIQAQP